MPAAHRVAMKDGGPCPHYEARTVHAYRCGDCRPIMRASAMLADEPVPFHPVARHRKAARRVQAVAQRVAVPVIVLGGFTAYGAIVAWLG